MHSKEEAKEGPNATTAGNKGTSLGIARIVRVEEREKRIRKEETGGFQGISNICGIWGHSAKFCRYAGKGGGAGSMPFPWACNNCGIKGHKAQDCRKPKGGGIREVGEGAEEGQQQQGGGVDLGSLRFGGSICTVKRANPIEIKNKYKELADNDEEETEEELCNIEEGWFERKGKEILRIGSGCGIAEKERITEQRYRMKERRK